MRIHYDEEGDYLTIFVGESKPNYGEDVSDYITLFKDSETGDVVGIGILNFKDRSKDLHQIKLDLPIDIGLFVKK